MVTALEPEHPGWLGPAAVMFWVDDRTAAFGERHATAESALRRSGMLLAATGKVDPSYTSALVDAYRRHGPYMVIGPGIAIAHAEPGAGVYDAAFSVLTCTPPVRFGHPRHDPVRMVIGLATPDVDAHAAALEELTAALRDPDRRRRLLAASSAAEFMAALLVRGRQRIGQRARCSARCRT